MKYKEYISLFTKRFFKKQQIVRDPQIMHPDREWAIGLFVAALMFAVSGYWSIQTYLSNRSATAHGVVDDKAETVYRASIVKEALETVRNRERELQNLTTSVVLPESTPEVASTTLEDIDTIEPIVEVSASSTNPTLEE
jgi:hypothetical protein